MGKKGVEWKDIFKSLCFSGRNSVDCSMVFVKMDTRRARGEAGGLDLREMVYTESSTL